MTVDSDDPAVRRLLATIAETVVEHGGYVHPQLVVRHHGASLWLELPRTANPHLTGDDGTVLDRPHPAAPPLLIIPDDLHIPVTDLDWIPSDSELAYRGSTDHLSIAQRTILDAMVALFNAVDKVSMIGQSYARHSLAADPELLAKLQQARPGFKPFGEVTVDDGMADSPAATVVRSRLRSGMVEGEEGPIGFFMPMIDLLNHHPYGSRYERTPEGHWLIRVHHPGPTDQVFVRYNAADSLGNALGLGYAETATRFVSSVACRFWLPGVGEVRVIGMSGRMRRVPAPQVAFDDDGVRVGPIILAADRLMTLRTLLAMPLRARAATATASGGGPDGQGIVSDGDGEAASDVETRTAAEDPERVAGALITRVVEANVEYYRELRELCARTDRGDAQQRALFAAVADHQLHLLRQVSAELPSLGLG